MKAGSRLDVSGGVAKRLRQRSAKPLFIGSNPFAASIPLQKKMDMTTFPEFRDLGLQDREILKPIFESLQPEISDRSFTNLFMWQDFYKIKLAGHQGNTLLYASSTTTPEKEFFFPPLGSERISGTIQTCFDYLKERGAIPIIRRASEQFVWDNYLALNNFQVKRDDDISDYIYRAEDLISLKGRRYNGQRNFISRFKRSYQYSVEEIGPANIGECMAFCDAWLANKTDTFVQRGMPEQAFTFLRAETSATKKTLRHFETLELTGIAIRIDERLVAITIGELLNRDTALIHVEKCNHTFLGLSQFISQEFCRLYWSGCKFINRMEDLGIESLRKAKIALGPHHMARKHNILPKP